MNIDATNTDSMRFPPSSGEPRAQANGNGAAAAGPVPPSAPAPSPGLAEVQASVENANRYMRGMNQNLQFEVDRGTGKTVVRVVDSETKEVVRQIPSEEMLAIARALSKARGLLLNESA